MFMNAPLHCALEKKPNILSYTKNIIKRTCSIRLKILTKPYMKIKVAKKVRVKEILCLQNEIDPQLI